MISRLRGVLLSREEDRIEVQTPGGVVYRVEVPLSVLQRLPDPGSELEIRTLQIVREDSVALYGFIEDEERELFVLLMSATGIGAKLASGMLSLYSASRLARALAERDLAALTRISGVGKKTAERIVVELSDKAQELAVTAPSGAGDRTPLAREAISALVALGYSFGEADRAIHRALEEGAPETAQELIRAVLSTR